ncbi:hypothetical protein [Chloroherpeton thalassium]|uniref:hypothetical protein n=1 Tax=Chloroherpeton thalassium TaxID=100716 RepID=UPI00031DB800|nr:hypothetical protein [Chloroherpeton thalassium]
MNDSLGRIGKSVSLKSRLSVRCRLSKPNVFPHPLIFSACETKGFMLQPCQTGEALAYQNFHARFFYQTLQRATIRKSFQLYFFSLPHHSTIKKQIVQEASPSLKKEAFSQFWFKNNIFLLHFYQC